MNPYRSLFLVWMGTIILFSLLLGFSLRLPDKFPEGGFGKEWYFSLTLALFMFVMSRLHSVWAYSKFDNLSMLIQDCLMSDEKVKQFYAIYALSIVAGCRYGLHGIISPKFPVCREQWLSWWDKNKDAIHWDSKLHRYIEN